MSENNGTKILLAFIAGAAVGAAIGYYLNSDKKDELITDLKEGATKLKQDIETNLHSAKDIVEHFTRETAGSTTENPA